MNFITIIIKTNIATTQDYHTLTLTVWCMKCITKDKKNCLILVKFDDSN